MTEVVLETFGVSRSFRRGAQTVEALSPATCRVRAGDRIALVGASGSGKSTLLYVMAGLDEPSAGVICWPNLGERDTLRPKKISVVFQSPSLMPSLSVIENVQLPLILAGEGGNSQRVAMEAIERVGLAGLGQKLPEELSGGQAQRVAMARAMASRPQLILADETVA